MQPRLRMLYALAGLSQETLSSTLKHPRQRSFDWTACKPCWSGGWFSHVAYPVVPFPLPQTGEGIAECEVIKWLVKEGDKIEKFDKVCEVQSDKASIEISSPYEGVVASIPHQPGDVVKVGSTLMEIGVADDSSTTTEKTKTTHNRTPESNVDVVDDTTPVDLQRKTPVRNETERVLASPAVRLFAKDNKVDLSKIRPTGLGNRVEKEDIVQFLRMQTVEAEKTADEGVSKRRIPIRGFRRGMLKSMTAALSIPHFHFCDDFDMTSLVSLRQRLEEPQLRGQKLAFLPVLIKTLSTALSEFPEANSTLSTDQSELLLHDTHNIGIAMATDEGLVVPNIKNVQSKTILQITQELQDLKMHALQNTFQPEDLTDTTITLSNVGSIGGIYATPLITPPQAAIVALGSMRSVLQVENNKEKIQELRDIRQRPLLPISWGADHRILDGAALVRLSNRWKQFVEEPERLSLFLK